MPCTSDKDLEHFTTHLSFEAQLWLAADKLRNNVNPAEHKHVVLGIIFLKFLPHPFESQRATHALIEPDNPRQTGVSIVAKPGTFADAVAMPLHTDQQARWESLADKESPQGYVMPSLAGLQNGGKQSVSRQFHPIIPDVGVRRRKVTHPAGRRFAKRSFHYLRHTFVPDQSESHSTPGIGGNLTGHKTASVHDLDTHFERETSRAALHAIPFPPELYGKPRRPKRTGNRLARETPSAAVSNWRQLSGHRPSQLSLDFA